MPAHIQQTYRDGLNEIYAGMIANTMPCTRESGVLQTDGNRPDSLPFGFACGWVDENQVARVIDRRPVSKLNAEINAAATSLVLKSGEFIPGHRHIAVGDYLILGTEWMLVTAAAAAGLTIVRGQYGSTAATHAADSPIFVVGGRTTFAGVAVKDVTIRADNTPGDTFNSGDHVPVGTSGDFVVVCDASVSRGDAVSINVGSTAADYGKFSNASPVHSSRKYIGLPGAVFMTDSQSVTAYSLGSVAQTLAVLRLTTQAA